MTSQNDDDEEVKTKKAYIDKRTPAQIAFDKTQEKRVRMKHLVSQLSSVYILAKNNPS